MTDTTTSRADEIRAEAREHLWHPLLQHQTLQQRDLMVIEKGQGTTITDADGRQYLDAYAGLWNVNVGYGREEIARAVYEQMQRLPFYPLSQINEPAARLAAKLAELLPGDLQHIFYANSGSEANETAFKIARQYARQKYPGENRYKIIARYQGYHGFTYGAMSATGQVGRRTKFEPLVPGFLHVDPPYCYRCPVKLSYPDCGVACVDQFETVIRREGPDTVAAVVVEPVIGGGGVIAPPEEYMPRLRQICDQYGVLMIVDEVITGFGRTGKLFACEHWDVVPDIMSMAKGATSGYLPLGACAVTPEVFETFLGEPGQGRELAQVSTYGGHPVCCAAGLANIDIILRERLWENAARVGPYLQEKLRAIKSDLIGDVRGKGLMIGVELVGEDGAMLDAERTARFGNLIREEGILVGKMAYAMAGSESVFCLSPPLILTEAEADRIAAAFQAALDKV